MSLSSLMNGTLFLSVSIFLICVMALICRNPRTPEWMSDFVSFMVLPLVVGLMGLGTAIIVTFIVTFNTASLNVIELGLSAAILLITAVAIRALRIKKRLAGYERMKTAQVVELSSNDLSTPPPPQNPQSVKRAA